jgi:16S rRNA (cytosine967-C5)-methyltransferase
LLEAENEAVAASFGETHGTNFKVLPAQEVLAKAHAGQSEELVRGDFLRLWPHRHGTDAFFAAVWERV